MLNKHFTAFLVGTSLLVAPAQQAAAGGKDFLIGLGVGAVGATIINNERRKKRTVRRTTRSTGWSASRQQMYEVQTALNYFGFPAGKPDGVAGRNTRNAVSQYQIHLGYPATGQLTEFERQFLLSSHQRAIAGGVVTQQQVAQNPQGPRGLLITYRDQQLNPGAVAPGAAPQTTIVVNPQPQQQPVQVLNTTPQTQPQQQPVQVASQNQDANPLGALPTFGAQPQQVSMASRCNEINLVTSSNGGYTTSANITDAAFAMSEQFCLARSYAITHGEQLESGIQGVTRAQIQAQCESFAPAMSSYIASLSLKPRQQVMSEVEAFVLSTGMAPAQLSSTARICLGVGYRTDNADVVLASSLLLVALGEPTYGELLGHHLVEGFGTTKRKDLAMPWYQNAVAAIDGGAAPAFGPGLPDRVQVLKAAMVGLNGAPIGDQSTNTAPQTQQPAFVVPAFNNAPVVNN